MSTMTVTPRVQVPTAYAPLWLVGDQPQHGMTGAWEAETLSLRLVRRLHEHMRRSLDARLALRVIERLSTDGTLDPDSAVTRRSQQERELFVGLVELRDTLEEMRRHQMALPRLVDQETLVAMAKSRGITLPVRAAEQLSPRRRHPDGRRATSSPPAEGQ